jgi:hypothetical protein
MATNPPGRVPPASPPPVPPTPPSPPAVSTEGVDALLAEAEAQAVALAATARAAEDRTQDDAAVAATLAPDGHDLHPLLTNSEVLDIRAQARDAVLAKQKAAAKKDLLARETRRLAEEEGVSGATGNPELDEPVTISLDLAEHSANIVVNGRPYWHGHTYTVPRHIANSLAEIQFRGWDHQRVLDGKGTRERLQRANTLHIDKAGQVHREDRAN